MKRILLSLTLVVLSALLTAGAAACRHDDGSSSPEPEFSYHRLAGEYFNSDSAASAYMPLQIKAVELVRNGTSPDDPVEVLSQMGLMYNTAGDYGKGMEYLLEADEYLRHHPESSGGAGEIQLYGNLATLYSGLGMPRESLEMNDRALDVSHRNGDLLLSDIWRMRAYAYDHLNKPDSVMYCYNMALEAVDSHDTAVSKQELRDGIKIEIADLVFNTSDDREEIALWLDTLAAIDSRTEWDPSGRLLTFGTGYIAMGEVDKGLELFRDGLAELDRTGDVSTKAWAAKRMIKLYAMHGRPERMADTFRRYGELIDSIDSQEKLAMAATAGARYSVRLHREEKEALRLKLRNSRLTAGFTAAILILLAVFVFIVLRQRNHRREAERRMLLDQVSELNRIRAELTAIIDSRSQPEPEPATDTAKPDETADEPTDFDALVKSLIEKEAENRFRKSFAKVYPRFLPALQERWPALTPGNRLICMLIYLRLNTDDIAAALGISRESVNKARYRIRLRMNLPNETDLDRLLHTLV